MSTSSSPFGIEPYPDDDGAEEVLVAAPARERTPLDPRVLRSLLGGAAAVAVIGAGAAGFLWISSTPSGDVADAAFGGVRSTPPVVGDPGPVRATGVAFGGRDLFSASATAGSGGGGALPSTEVLPATTAPPAARPVAPPVPVSTTPPGGRATSVVPPPPPPAAPPATGAPSGPPSVVAPPVSSAPGWVTPVVRFLSGSPAAAVLDVDGETRTFAVGQAVYPLGIVYAGTVVEATPSPTPS
ncbi:hypothetical protein GTR02_21905, partial [Kineococcus sp. R8]|nr:hypothetical protein [Kineococcus siccus]